MRWWIAMAVTGCGVDDPCLEEKLTVESGVYGLIRGEAGVFVSVFATDNDTAPPTHELIASTKTDEDGYYELELPAQGGYELCRSYWNDTYSGFCVTVVTTSPPVRWDVVQGGDLVGDKWHQFICVEE